MFSLSHRQSWKRRTVSLNKTITTKKEVEQAHWFNLQCIYQAFSFAEGSIEMPELLLLLEGMALYQYERDIVTENGPMKLALLWEN